MLLVRFPDHSYVSSCGREAFVFFPPTLPSIHSPHLPCRFPCLYLASPACDSLFSFCFFALRDINSYRFSTLGSSHHPHPTQHRENSWHFCMTLYLTYLLEKQIHFQKWRTNVTGTSLRVRTHLSCNIQNSRTILHLKRATVNEEELNWFQEGDLLSA